MKKIVLLAITFSLFHSCSSSSDEITSNPEIPKPVVPEPAKQKKITEVKQDNQLLYKFTYNSDGKISQIENYSNTGSLSSTTKVEYTNGVETKRSSYNLKNELYSYHTYTYTGKYISEEAIYLRIVSTGQEILTQKIFYTNDPTKSAYNLTGAKYYDEEGDLMFKNEITYLDSNGSSVSNVYNAGGAKINVITWMSDDAIAWDKVLNPFIYQHEHNTTSVSDNNLLASSTTGYTIKYTYDSSNYPLTAKSLESNGTKHTFTFTWE